MREKGERRRREKREIRKELKEISLKVRLCINMC
jgi:hypothetical protein